MKHLPSFETSLFQKNAYGYDVSGEVRDSTNINMHDLSLLETQGHPQSGQANSESLTLPPSKSLYFGTTKEQWNKPLVSMILTTDKSTAEMLAEEAHHKGMTVFEKENNYYPLDDPQYDPLVMFCRFEDIPKNLLGPEKDYATTHPGANWQESLQETGVLTISGDLEFLKAKFKLII